MKHKPFSFAALIFSKWKSYFIKCDSTNNLGGTVLHTLISYDFREKRCQLFEREMGFVSFSIFSLHEWCDFLELKKKVY